MTTCLKKSFKIWLMLLCVKYNILSSSKWGKKKKKTNPREDCHHRTQKNDWFDSFLFYVQYKIPFYLICQESHISFKHDGWLSENKNVYEQKSKTWTNSVISKLIKASPSLQSYVWLLHAFCKWKDYNLFHKCMDVLFLFSL